MSLAQQVKFMKKRGIVLGTRWKDGRHVHMYMFRNLFAEVLYKNDDPAEEAEKLEMISGLAELNKKLEKEMKLNR
jgi:hypothetical protein